jgi:hypothetical protein
MPRSYQKFYRIKFRFSTLQFAVPPKDPNEYRKKKGNNEYTPIAAILSNKTQNMRFSTILVASLGVIVGHAATLVASTSMEEGNAPERVLQDQTVCDSLKQIIEANTTASDISGSCQCSTTSGGDTRLACSQNNLCLSSNGGTPMQGDFSATYTKAAGGTSYSQNITTEICFDYPSDVYDGQKVCVSNSQDGFGVVATCLIQVGGKPCNVCRYCPVNLISFDCSNLGFEDRTACADNNTNDSILQFMYEPTIATGCTGGGSSAAPSTFPPTASPKGGAVSMTTVLALVASFVPLFLMG